MKFASKIATILGAAAICAAPALTQAAEASNLGGWNYQYDRRGDGYGGSNYDIRGMAMFRDANRVYVALTGGTPLAGHRYGTALNGSIGWGDLFFNFSGKSFAEAQASGQLMGVRFAANNDSTVRPLGVYSNVTTESHAAANAGYGTIQAYYDAGFGGNASGSGQNRTLNLNQVTNTHGSALSTQAAVNSYLGNGAAQTSIASGNLIGGISLLTSTQLSSLGLNFGSNRGNHTFGFSFDANLLPTDNFMANVFLECSNDGMAFAASGAPEPTTMAGVAMGIAGIAGFKRRRKQQKSTEAAQ
jgi:PEP-CTERM motif